MVRPTDLAPIHQYLEEVTVQGGREDLVIVDLYFPD
jgi:hypothetical protein